MNEQVQPITQGDVITLYDAFLFLKSSGRNIVKSTLVCLLAGGTYIFSVPNMYEASATIEMAKVVGEAVETPVFLFEKIKLPMYFSSATLQACGLNGELSERVGFFNKIKPSINKSAPLVTFVTKAPSSQEAKACLSVVIAEITNKQDKISEHLLQQKKQKLQEMSEQLKLTEEFIKTFSTAKGYNNSSDEQFSVRTLYMSLKTANVDKAFELRSQISNLDYLLSATHTHSVLLTDLIYAPNEPVKKSRMSILGLCLVLGVFLGLFMTWMMRMASEIGRQMREAEDRGHKLPALF